MEPTVTNVPLDARGLPPGYPFNPEWEVTPRDAKSQLEKGAVLLDCRTSQERDLARIPGSVHVPMQELGSRIEQLRDHEDDVVIVHCHHGGRSLKVAAALRSAGFTDVKSMAGGIHLWSQTVDPTIPAY